MKRVVTMLAVLFLGVVFYLNCSESRYFPTADKVILIGIDGVGTEALQTAETPNLDKLIARGCLSLKARGVMPTVSSPNWASMLCGAGPEQHGITSNSWRVDQRTIEPVEADAGGWFPSIFTLLAEQRPEVRTGLFYDWAGLANLFNPEFIDSLVLTKSGEETLQRALPLILSDGPAFAFLYFGLPDEEGHAYGYTSPEHYHSISRIDSLIGVLVRELEKAGLAERVPILVVSDHGGVGKGHGGESMTEIQVPWIIAGPGIRKGVQLQLPLNSFDTAPTIAALFGLKTPPSWIGKPVWEAVE